MRISDFIQKVLIDEFKEIQQAGEHPYISFNLICQGIEFLGACLDSEPFSGKGLSAPRFRRAIEDLFPTSYHPFNQGTGKAFDLYENFRCSFLYVMLPRPRLKLIRRTEKPKFNANHLEVKEIQGIERLVLVLEDLFEDFERACEGIIRRINEGRLRGWKFAEDLLK
ncbi:MAG: hypothetical protein HXY44_19405 [Syntrophaceae bacterium]|nr:hypothetical protein [Syntrophaceae bacterium]